MSATLRFDITAIRTLRTLALSAENPHKPYSKEPAKPGFFLVKDDGIYLLPNGTVPMEAEGRVVYAKGYNPKVDRDVWEKSVNAVGGDDFAESFDFDDNLNKMLDNPRAKAVIIRVSATRMSLSVEFSEPEGYAKFSSLKPKAEFYASLKGSEVKFQKLSKDTVMDISSGTFKTYRMRPSMTVKLA